MNSAFHALQNALGLAKPVPVLGTDGVVRSIPRVYLDSAATTLMPVAVFESMRAYLENACANSHTVASAQGRETTEALHLAHDLVGRLVGYDPRTDCVIFLGNGTTAATNLLAQALFRSKGRHLVAISEMEHHSNSLPWTRAVGGPNNTRVVPVKEDGTLDLAKLKELFDKEGSNIRAIAVTAVSNVTGVINPIDEIAKMAHEHGIQIAVDAAQAVAHIPIAMHRDEASKLDHIVFSGHKLYAPGSPGVIVTNRSTFANAGWDLGQVGGGTVEYVGSDAVQFKEDVVERQEAGTPNIPGSIALGTAAGLLLAIGMQNIRAHEMQLTDILIRSLASIPSVVVYGPHDSRKRAGVVAFNVGHMHHSLVAAALNDFFAVAVRNDCFCAQPYVREQLDAACETQGFCLPPEVRGMVRASLGAYSTEHDIRRLAQAVAWIQANEKYLESLYVLGDDGEYHHKSFRTPPQFQLDRQIVRPAGQVSGAPGGTNWVAIIGLGAGLVLLWYFTREPAPLAHRELPQRVRSRILR